MIDAAVLCIIAVAAVFGLIRGVVSQVMAILGLVAAYFFASRLAAPLVVHAQHYLGSSRFTAEKVSILLAGLAIYVAFRLIGFWIEKLCVDRVKPFKKLNRAGGAVLGAVKAAAILAVAFCFLALASPEDLRARAPKLLESRSYKLAVKYNPMGKQAVLERMRRFRSTVNDPARAEKLQKSDELEKILARYEMKDALKDERFLQSVREGDYDTLRRSEQVEKLMNDEKLTSLLVKLENN